MPSLTQLEYVLAVDQHRHFGKAAAACHVAQPTLSQQISKLEDELGLILFDRLQKPVLPTPEGESFIRQARIVLREHRRLIESVHKQKAGLVGTFRLGVIHTVAPYLTPLFIEDFSKKHPGVSLSIEEMKTEAICDELEKDRLDGAIMATPLAQKDLKQHPIFYEPFHLYLSKGHPLQKKKLVTEADLDGSQMWFLKDGHCFKDQVVRYCSIDDEDIGSVFKNVQFQSGNLDTLRYLVQKSHGYTMIPALMKAFMTEAEAAQHVRSFVAPVPTREISFVYRRDHWKLEIIEALKTCIQDSLPDSVSRTQAKNHHVLEIC